MAAPSVSIHTHTIKHDVTTTIVARTTTINSEHEDVFSESDGHYHHPGHGVVEGVKKSLKDHWHGAGNNGEDDDEQADHEDPSLSRANSVMRRAYDYWKSLAQDSEKAANVILLCGLKVSLLYCRDGIRILRKEAERKLNKVKSRASSRYERATASVSAPQGS
ncbi:hypothetical protein BGX34_004350 [Mortierella sp. NVP85]|nr:hypothetical protein BGX34_004350 [Mortierella sp. NVP85]